MMQNIEPELLRAIAKSNSWSSEAALTVTHRIAEQINATVDWDDGAGEDWMRLMREGKVQLIVRRDFPFVIKTHDWVFDSNVEIEVVEIQDMDDACLTCSESTLESVFPGRFPIPDWDPESFSASDLWWATI